MSLPHIAHIALVLYDLLIALINYYYYYLFIYLFLLCGQSCDLVLSCVYKQGIMYVFIV